MVVAAKRVPGLEEAHGYALEVDLFASPLNHKLPDYVARFDDPRAIAQDALSLQWNRWSQVYLLSPTALVPEVARKLQEYAGGGLLVVLASKFHNLLLPRRCLQRVLPIQVRPCQTVQGRRIFDTASSTWIALSF